MKLVMPRLPLPGLGARGGDEDLAHTCVGDEDLGAVDDVVITLGDGGGRRSAGIAPGAGFSQPESAHHLPRCEQRHVALLLLVGAELDDR